jgi:dihydroorotase
MSIIIKKGRIIDPAQNIDCVKDIHIEQNKITRIADSIPARADEIIDAQGMIVMPGGIDMHVHLREPGREDKETIATATRAALRGGITSLVAMPNTTPCMDSLQSVGLLQKKIQKTALNNVLIAGAITKNRKGHALVDFKGLSNKGVVAFTDDGDSVNDERLLSQAFELAGLINALIICHCEDTKLTNHGSVNKGIISTRMGLRGISKESEYQRVERDIRLAATSKARIHIAHVSCKESLDIIRSAKKEGIQVTAETCPHYIALCEDDIIDFDTNKKMNPPLRSAHDRAALRKALQDGTIDVLSSDHAPHTDNEKDIEFERAAFGVIGLETILAVAFTELVDTGIMDWMRLATICSHTPANILGLDKGDLSVGRDADLIVFQPGHKWRVNKADIWSKSKNSPFLGRELQGRVLYTIIGGKIAYNACSQGSL